MKVAQSEKYYQVNFHLIQILYFKNDKIRLLGSDYINSWRAMSSLGEKRRLNCIFWDDDEIDHSQQLRSHRLGSLEPVQHLVNKKNCYIGGGGGFVKKRKLQDQQKIATCILQCQTPLAAILEKRCLITNWPFQVNGWMILERRKF